MDEKPSGAQPWSWPERSEPGARSSTGASPTPESGQASSQGSAPPDPDLGSLLESSQGYEVQRALVVRSATIAVATTLVSIATSFGLDLTEAQSTALIGAVPTVLTVFALFRKRRKRSG